MQLWFHQSAFYSRGLGREILLYLTLHFVKEVSIRSPLHNQVDVFRVPEKGVQFKDIFVVELPLDFYFSCYQMAVLYADWILFNLLQGTNKMLFFSSGEVDFSESTFSYRHTDFKILQAPILRVVELWIDVLLLKLELHIVRSFHQVSVLLVEIRFVWYWPWKPATGVLCRATLLRLATKLISKEATPFRFEKPTLGSILTVETLACWITGLLGVKKTLIAFHQRSSICVLRVLEKAAHSWVLVRNLNSEGNLREVLQKNLGNNLGPFTSF